jgi:Tfp pilus assembly protein PilF
MMEGRNAEAEQLLIKAIKEDSNYVDAYLRLSSIYYKQGNTTSSASNTKKCCRFNPNSMGFISTMPTC